MGISGSHDFSAFVRQFRPLLIWAQRIFSPLALCFLLYFAWRSRDTLTQVASDSQPGWLALSILLWFTGHFLAPLFSIQVMAGCGSTLTYYQAFQIHTNRLPARYLPGGIWHTVARVSDFSRLGIRGSHLTAFVLLENLMAVAVTFLIGGLSLIYFQNDNLWAYIGFGAVFGSALALSLLPPAINRLTFPEEEHFSLSDYGRAIGITVIFWAIAASAFVAFTAAFPGLFLDIPILEVAGVYIFSWAVGNIALFAPQGIGVVEATAGVLLNPSLNTSEIIVFFSSFRLVIFIGDISAWFISQMVSTIVGRST